MSSNLGRNPFLQGPVYYGPTPPLNAPNGTIWMATPDPAQQRRALRLKRFRWALLTWCVVFAIWDAALATVDKHAWAMATHAFFALFQALIAADTLRRIRNGNREARENHRSRVTVTGPATFVGTHFPATVETTSLRLDLPVEKTTDRIQAVKLARLVVDPNNGQLRLHAVWQNAVHPIEGDASCAMLPGWSRKEHPVPVPWCKCGFHAWKTEADALAYRSSQWNTIATDLMVVMHVELFGTVIAHERGYRAQRQRVLGVEIPARCEFCVRPADRLAVRFDRFAQPVCGVDMLTYRPYFNACLTLGDVASQLGCEVTWENR